MGVPSYDGRISIFHVIHLIISQLFALRSAPKTGPTSGKRGRPKIGGFQQSRRWYKWQWRNPRSWYFTPSRRTCFRLTFRGNWTNAGQGKLSTTIMQRLSNCLLLCLWPGLAFGDQWINGWDSIVRNCNDAHTTTSSRNSSRLSARIQ